MTHSFRQKDLPDLIEVAQRAQKIVQDLEQTQNQRLKISR
jgi:hypothetical protein